MKFALGLLTATLLCAQQVPQQTDPAPESARVEGLVLSSIGEPVVRAQVTLTAGLSFANGNPMPGPGYQAATDDKGRFIFENVQPEVDYTLQADKSGFAAARYGARSQTQTGVTLRLEKGEVLGGLKLTLRQQGAINGQVLDRDGDPLANIQLVLMRRGYQDGERTILPGESATTDDRGVFRLSGLEPGRYYLMASAMPNIEAFQRGRNSPNGVARDPDALTAMPTYYPSSPDLRNATPLDLAAGEELRGVDVRMRQSRVFTVSGRVLKPADKEMKQGMVIAVPEGTDLLALRRSPAGGQMSQGQMAEDGGFLLSGLGPGVYDVLAVDPQGIESGNLNFGISSFTIGQADLTGVTIRMGGGGTIIGTLRLEGEELSAILPAADNPLLGQMAGQGIPVALISQLARMIPELAAVASQLPLTVALTGSTASVIPIGPASDIKPDGSFSMVDIAPGNYQLKIAPLPPDVYIKAVRFREEDARVKGVSFGQGEEGAIQIVLERKAAHVSISVPKEAAIGATVALWSKDPRPGLDGKGVYTAITDRKGVVKFHSLPPGEYYVAAFEEVDPSLAMARDFVQQLEADATKLKLDAGATAEQALELIPAEATRKAEEELP